MAKKAASVRVLYCRFSCGTMDVHSMGHVATKAHEVLLIENKVVYSFISRASYRKRMWLTFENGNACGRPTLTTLRPPTLFLMPPFSIDVEHKILQPMLETGALLCWAHVLRILGGFLRRLDTNLAPHSLGAIILRRCVCVYRYVLVC